MKEDFGTQLEDGSLRFVRLLPGPIERAWSYLVDPDKRGLWFAGGTMGEKAGDEFTWDFDFDLLSEENLPERWSELSEGLQSHARIVEIEPPRLLVVVGIEDKQEIRFELRELEDQLEFVLTQQPPADFSGLVSTAAGWQACLGLLIDHLHDRKPRRFWSEHEKAEENYRERLSPSA